MTMVSVLSAILAASLSAQGPSALTIKDHGRWEWQVPGSLPPGAEFHLIFENKITHAVQILVRYPSGYSLPSHSHSHNEVVVVIKGKLEIESGGERTTIGPGGYAYLPAGAVHGMRAKGWGKCLFTVSLDGPFDVKHPPASQ